MEILDVIQRSTERNLIWETKCSELEDPYTIFFCI